MRGLISSKQCSNNVDEAKIRHEIETLYGVPTAHPETKAHQTAPEYDLDFLSYESSDDDLIITPSPGKASPGSPKAPSRRPPPPKKPQKLRNPRWSQNENEEAIENPAIPNSHLPAQRPFSPDQDGPSVFTPESTFHQTPEPNNWPQTEPMDIDIPIAPPTPTENANKATDLRNFGNQGSSSDVNSSESQPKRRPSTKEYYLRRLLQNDLLKDLPDDHYSEVPASVDSQPEDTVVDDTLPEDPMVEDVKEPEWNFILPEIPAPPSLTPGVGEGNDGFSLRDLVGAIQTNVDVRLVTEYLAYYDPNTVRRHLCDTLEGFPSIFFAVGTNNEILIRKWIEHGADVSAIHKSSGVPLLAFAIMNSEQLDSDTTLTVSTLLSLGALPEVIPSSFYTPFSQDLPDNGPSDENLKDDLQDETKSWCSPAARSKLARTANITQRYYLERASKTKKPSLRQRQVAKLRNAEALLGISYFLIGQSIATTRLFQKLLNYMMVRTKRPLVMVFAGPSGHGKTELARRLGHLMSLDLEIVDCTIYNREIELFGPRNPYVGAEKGSPLNNFLVKNAGKRCIVFLDEFEKTTTDIHQALLVPFDNG